MNARLCKSLLPALLIATAVAIWAQDAEQERIFRERVDVVVAPTTILDKDGNYVTGIRPSEFRLFDNNQIQNIRVEEAVEPVSLVVAVQANVKVEAVLPIVKKMGTMLSNLVAGESGEVAILSFDHRIQLLQDFTNDTSRIQEALQRLRPGSSSSRVIDATMEASRMLRTRPKGHRRVLLLISESRDIASEGNPREALTNLEVNNVIVYALNISRVYTELTAPTPPPAPDPIPVTARPPLPGGVAQTPTQQAQITGRQGQSANFVPMFAEIFRATKAVFVDNPIELFTAYTGGKETGFVNQRDLEKALSSVGREIHNLYIISYNPTNKEEGGFHTIRVEVARPGLDVRTRGGYWIASIQ
jgi:VWFA-related protein